MHAVITGDIVHSRAVQPTQWLTVLKNTLVAYGVTPADWEIFRGDSFQLLTTPAAALHTAFVIKAQLKQIKQVDVRMAIGLGTVAYKAANITESNGSAFVHAGTAFDAIKKNTLVIQSDWPALDTPLNIMLALAGLTINRWTVNTATIMAIKLQQPHLNQKEIAQLLNKKGQGNISEALQRGGYYEVEQLLAFYQQQIKEYAAISH